MCYRKYFINVMIYIFLIIIFIILTYFILKKYENFITKASFHPTIIGGSTASKINFTHRPNHSTNIIKLLGNSDDIVILVHNTPFNHHVWQPLYMIAQEAKNNGEKIPTLISYDLLGHNTAWIPVSDKYNNDKMDNYIWSYDEFVADLFELYSKLVGTGKFTLVGYGFGGSIAQAFSLRHPELIEKLYVLGTTIGPTKSGIPDETKYLVQWISRNPNVTYLTMDESYVQWSLCIWFSNKDPIVCSEIKDVNRKDDDFNTFEFLLAQRMFRQASCTTHLQMNKMVATEDLRPIWQRSKVPFPIVFLIAENDHYTNIDQMKNDMRIIQNASPNVQMYITRGKHGFPMMNPKYIYNLIRGNDMSTNMLTIDKI